MPPSDVPISQATGNPNPRAALLRLLSEMGDIIAETVDSHDAFGKVLMLLQERLGFADGGLFIVDESSGRLRCEAFTPGPRGGLRPEYQVGEGTVGQVAATGKLKTVSDLGGGVGAKVLICVPITLERRVIGVLAVERPPVVAARLLEEQELLEVVCAFLAQAIKLQGRVLRHKAQLLEENAQLRAAVRDRYRFENIIGDAPAMNDVFATVGQVADSRATVLLLGETGTGKELIAKSIHYNSPRRDKPFVRVNCGAMTSTLLESELFGHVKGSFTGAIRDKMGRFEAADGGTLFLDEIGTLEPQLQVKLLRVLQEREFERVGDTRTVKIDVRAIAATNIDLQEAVANGRFREDLYYRLNVVSIYLPPLRNRREDIPRLIDFFLDKYNTANNRALKRISRDLLGTLLRYPWPGNVRELENAIERAVALSRGEDFTEDLLPLTVRMFAAQRKGGLQAESSLSISRNLAEQALIDFEARHGHVYQLVIDQIETALIERALAKCGGVKTKTADFLGINRNTLNKKVKDLGIISDD